MDKSTIIKAATKAAEKYGYERITRDIVAQHAGCSPALVSHYVGDMGTLRCLVMQHAIDSGNTIVLCQGLGARNPRAMAAPAALKKAAMRYMTND